jgi:hypothetical protein
MGRKTIRNFYRVECDVCNGHGCTDNGKGCAKCNGVGWWNESVLSDRDLTKDPLVNKEGKLGLIYDYAEELPDSGCEGDAPPQGTLPPGS